MGRARLVLTVLFVLAALATTLAALTRPYPDHNWNEIRVPPILEQSKEWARSSHSAPAGGLS